MNTLHNFAHSILVFIATVCICHVSQAQNSDGTADLCNRVGTTPHSQVIRDKIYQGLKYLASKPASKDKAPFFKQYVDVQTNFNELYGEIKDNITILNNRRRVCNRYGKRIQDLVNKAEALNDQILDSAGVSNPAGLGIDDALKLVDWVWNKVKGLNASKKDTFYCQLKWADYSDVVAGTTDKPCPANSSTPADSSKKKNGGR